MRYAVNLPVVGEYSDPTALVALAKDAEAAGWDAVFVWDSLVFDRTAQPPVTDPWIVLAAIAAQTERVKIGTMIAQLARRRPWKVAREVVALDHLSGGRLILGVGLGFSGEAEFAQFGEEGDARVRADKLDEALAIIAGLCSGAPFSHAGRYYTVKETTFTPRPVQAHIPIWVAGYWSRSLAPFRRAARWDGVCPEGAGKMTLGDQRAMLEYIRRHLTQAGPFDVVRTASLPTGDAGKGRADIAAWAEAGVTWWIVGTTGRAGAYSAMRERILRGPPSV
jgi:alkanesulfonate monooxygenase SsuD/methylene tetrahydromethanopterin reductase-like flavin-dependent oxidoreductase (luciferase family)